MQEEEKKIKVQQMKDTTSNVCDARNLVSQGAAKGVPRTNSSDSRARPWLHRSCLHRT